MTADLQLGGRRILVTRAIHQMGKLSQMLRRAGAIPVEVPVLEILPPDSYDDLDRALRQLSGYDWLIFTSANTVRALVDRAAKLSVRLEVPDRTKAAAIGDATAKAAAEAGLNVELVPQPYRAESLLSALEGRMEGRRFLLARAAVARDILPDELRRAGARVDVVEAYRNGIPASAGEQLDAALSARIDAAAFTSSSSVTHLKQVANAAKRMWPFADAAAVSIGPITSRTLVEEGWPPAAEAKVADVRGLVAALAEYFR